MKECYYILSMTAWDDGHELDARFVIMSFYASLNHAFIAEVANVEVYTISLTTSRSFLCSELCIVRQHCFSKNKR